MLHVGVCCAVVSVPSGSFYTIESPWFLVDLWSPAGKELTSWLSCLLCFVTFSNVSWFRIKGEVGAVKLV